MSISAIILIKDEEELIKDCLESVAWADEIVVVNDGATPNMLELAKNYSAKIINSPKGTFSDKRNLGAKKTSGDWLLYIDIDERVTPLLKKEISSAVLNPEYSAYAIPRRNVLLGHEMKWGGWWPDYVLRLIKKENLVGWEGELHEQPKIEGNVGKLKNPLTHFSHRTLTEMVAKTNEWSEIEARLLYKSHHPKMVWWRFLSVGIREVWERGIKKLGFLDGTVGIIEIIYQAYSRMITYAKLWEMQITK